MNFEKHRDPKESIEIGMSAIPIKILGMCTTDPSANTISEGSANMSDKDCRRILEGISKGELWGNSWKTMYYVMELTGEEEKSKNGRVSVIFNITRMSECLGHYIEYHGKKYKIPNE